jgi:plasmid stabilization system protein ParE
MTYRVEVTARAGRDLLRIYQFIRAQDSAQAAAWFNGIENLVLSLNQHPDRGSVTPENKKLRHLLYGNKPNVYRIVYRVDRRARRVQVLHIRHGAMAPFKSQ